MASSGHKGKTDADLRLDAGDDALVFPDQAQPTDDSPTVISKTRPKTEPNPAARDDVTEAGIKPGIPDGSLVNNLRGRRLAHFELIEAIGVGGMAAVLRAHDTQLDRVVALKILPPEMAVDPENVQRFHQEAKAAARLDHQNIGRVFYCGEDQGLNFIAFEFVEGENLKTVLDRRGRLPVPEAVRYVLQIATGLEHASSRGVVHRDVKPSNIVITPNGQAKLVDMGLARNMERQEHDLTQSGVTLGTFDYISPEQAMEPREADARSDIYSLGCTFYHMLTGRGPVPEGTAAKKLHHHQHVAPADPRQLNPDVPDEIALILGRMMAKDPKQRYQRPLQLVQHLMQAARKVGAADDLPEGALFVDTPLPTGPRGRPLLIVTVMACMLAIAIGFLVTVPGDLPPIVPPAPGGKQAEKKDKRDEPPNPGNLVTPPTESIKDATAFAAAAKSPKLKDRSTLRIKDKIYLETLGQPISFTGGHDLVIERSGVGVLPQLVHLRPDDEGLCEGLVLAGGTYTFRNLLFQIEGGGDTDKAVAAIAIRGASHVRFEKCIFEQMQVAAFDPAQSRVASVLVDNDPSSGQPPPRVEFTACYFHGFQTKSQNPSSAGQVAVAVRGPADIRMNNCAFKPYGAFFQVLPSDFASPAISLDHCSGFVTAGPVFRFEPRASAKLAVQNCLFSRPTNTVVDRNEPDLIRQMDSTQIAYQGNNNRYHNLNALWSIGPVIRNNMTDFRDALANLPVGSYDEKSEAPTLAEEKSPWYVQAEPMTQDPEIAFQVKAEFADWGVKKCQWGELAPAPVPELRLAADQKLVDPDYKGTENNVFKSFKQALANLVSGDTLLVKPGKSGGDIKIAPEDLALGLDITIKAYGKTTPVLALGKPLRPEPYAFLRVLQGSVRFEGLHFVLESRKDGLAQSVVLLGDAVDCKFDRCVFTMKGRGNPTPALSVLAFIDPKQWMQTDDPRPFKSQVQFSNSFVRGDGDVVRMTACRPLKLDLDNTLVALSGSLANVHAVVGEDLPADQGPRLELTKVAAITRDPVFSLSSFKNGKGLACLHVKAESCLFAPIEGRPLVYLEAADVGTEDAITKYIEWKGGPNCAAPFIKFLEHKQPNDSGTMMMLDADRWKKLFSGMKTNAEGPTMPPLADLVLWQETPASFRPTNDPDGQFADFGPRLDLDPLVKALK